MSTVTYSSTIAFPESTPEVTAIMVGPRGLSAHDVAVSHGFVGNEEAWVLSLKGETGPQGVQGPIGVTPPSCTLVTHYICGGA